MPEVAGGFGPDTILADPYARPPLITRFHYEFNVWPHDPLLEAVACFIVTQALKEKILTSRASGVAFDDVEISKDLNVEEFYPDRELPKFVWLQVTGRAGIDDFGLSPKHDLVVSQRILDLLKEQAQQKSEDLKSWRLPPITERHSLRLIQNLEERSGFIMPFHNEPLNSIRM